MFKKIPLSPLRVQHDAELFFLFSCYFYKKVEEKFGRVTKFSYFCSDE